MMNNKRILPSIGLEGTKEELLICETTYSGKKSRRMELRRSSVSFVFK